MSAVRGWCPSAHRPMMSGDGLVVRVRPRMARLNAAQAGRLADLSEEYGNGLIDLTSRGNLQIRGVGEDKFPTLLKALIDAQLVVADPGQETALTVTPFPDTAGETEALVGAIEAVAGELPDLPDKMGVVVDTGDAVWLQETSGDFRFERAGGEVILRPDGAALGRPVSVETAGSALLELAQWFVETGGADSRRMRRHVDARALPDSWSVVAPDKGRTPPVPNWAEGHFGVAFGQLTSVALRNLVYISDGSSLIFTPWRSVVLPNISVKAADILVHGSGEEASLSDISVSGLRSRLLDLIDGNGAILIGDAADPRLNVVACPGAPRCSQASIETRDLATRLAPHVRSLLHVSGCAKGCARQKAAPLVLVGRNGAFDLVQDGKPQDDPIKTGIGEDDVIAFLTGLAAPGENCADGKSRTDNSMDEVSRS